MPIKTIVHVEDVFYPTAGYQINIIPKYMVKEGYDVYIVTSRVEGNYKTSNMKFFGNIDIEKEDERYSKETGVKIIRIPVKRVISNRIVFGSELFKAVKNLKPDILYVHGNDTLTAMRYILQIGKLNFPIVFDSHMLEIASKNKFKYIYRFIYRNIFTPKLKKFKVPVIRTQNDEYVEKCLGIPLTQAPWISVGTDTMHFQPNKSIRLKMRNELKINKDDFVIIYTGKINKSKGALLLAEAIQEKIKVLGNHKLIFIIVGNAVDEEGKKAEELLKKSENKVMRIPTQNYLDLNKYYQLADLAIFPKQCSLSFYDAQSCGLPVLSEDNKINADRLRFNNGFNFKSDDVIDLRKKIEMCVNLNKEYYEELKENAILSIQDGYDYHDLTKRYLEILKNEYSLFTSKYQFSPENRG
ncbi:glycosyltransferase family 4 protein [Sutcliffiella horikoshii]|uniref:Glycosyltransferase family 4 protein n=1 Tax=Sutcliffiella horikoshii TaxID=79883 RepID=A0A5D4T509_9BACI|nr:glycosyltransferase family 4 protein [Sutcliffiella horikoshii]TYS70001.1 glycosyltransferase family 4 protein [Sutcliffiella horikoshii]